MDLTGRESGGYRFDECIGTGHCSSVWLGEQLKLERPVALKVLEANATPETQEAFLEAGRNASRLMHRNILPTLDVCQTDGLYFIATEYIEGQSLQTLMSAKPYSLTDTLTLCLQIAGALTYAHDEGIIHGNLCPSNVLIGKDDIIRITDFCQQSWLSRDKPDSPSARNRSVYTPPEFYRGEPIGKQGDIFSAGSLFYMLCLASRPYSFDEYWQLVEESGHPQPRAPHRGNPEIPENISAQIINMLAARPEKRPSKLVGFSASMSKKLQEIEQSGELSHDQKVRQKASSLTPPHKRTYRRLRSDMDVIVQPVETTARNAEIFFSRIDNISENGAFVRSVCPKSVGTFISLEFTLKENNTRVHVLGIVRWVDTNSKCPGMGVQFLEVSTTDRSRLRDYVDDKFCQDLIKKLTASTTHKKMLKLILNNQGTDIPIENFAKASGASRTLLMRTLSDFIEQGFISINGETVSCLPQQNRVVSTLNKALINYQG